MEFIKILRRLQFILDLLSKYYTNQYSSIDESISKDLEKYSLGFSISTYFAYLSNKDASLSINQNSIEDIKKIVLKYINVIEVINNDNKKAVSFEYKNLDELKQKGFELDIDKATIEAVKIAHSLTLINNSTIIMLLINFEEIISSLFSLLINKYPEKYLTNKTLTYNDLTLLNYENIKEEFIKNELEAIMRKDIYSWLKDLQINHKIECKEINDYKDDMMELYYRRNIIVHNKGIVNKVYMDNVKNSKQKSGEPLITDKDYVIKAIKTTYIISYGIIFSALKICDDKDAVHKELFNIGFNHMINNDWEISRYIFVLLLSCKNINEDTKAMCKINYWISESRLSNLSKIKSQIIKTDFSAMKKDYVIAKHIILSEYEIATKLLNQSPTTFPSYCYDSWPLFSEYKLTSFFHDFKEKNITVFNSPEYKIDDKIDYGDQATINSIVSSKNAQL